MLHTYLAFLKKHMTSTVGLFLVVASVTLCVPTYTEAQEIHNSYQGTFRGEVVRIVSEEMNLIPGTNTEHLYQTIEIEILSGPQEGKVVSIPNDFLELEKGNKFYFNHNIYMDGEEVYMVTNIDRRGALLFFVLLIMGTVVLFGGWQGVRSLVSLFGSFLVIFYILLPGLLQGINPLMISVVVASLILFAAIFLTHGFNRESLVAYAGTMLAISITTILAIVAVGATDLSGFMTGETVYLNINTDGVLNFSGLLIGAIIIGILGVLDDVAVTQAAVVTELYNSNKNIRPFEVYRRALRVGREHAGALVNTIVLAYTGVSLPLLLHFHTSDISFLSLINSEVFATEIIRAVVGSIGLVMTVPIVTLLAVYYLKGYVPKHAHTHYHSHKH